MSYDIIRPLGRGGMGEVYLARDSRLDRQVALKTLRGDLAGTESEPELRREAQLLAQLNHPNIVQIYDITQYRGQLALVMEYVDGQNLHVARREGRGDAGDLLRWLAETAEGLAAAHAAGIAHRDLKAENVLITREGTAKVTDFGIASEAARESDLSADMLALGQLGRRLLAELPSPSPTVVHLLDQLESRRPGRRPDAAAAAEGFRLAWHESSQEETLPQRSNRPSRWRELTGIALALLAAAAVGGWLLWRPQQALRVAVVEPKLTETGELGDSQLAALRTTVQQALLQAALEDPGLVLLGAAETAAVSGSASTMATALGADEVIAPTLRCGALGCDLSIERIDPSGAVLRHRSIALPLEAELEAYNMTQAQWPLLYPQHTQSKVTTPEIGEAAYREFLQLHYLATAELELAEDELLPRVEALLDEAPTFLPLYQLHTHLALNQYDDTGEPAYAQRAMGTLESVPGDIAESPLVHRAQLDIALELGDFDRADRELEALRRLGASDLLLARLSGRRYSYEGDFAAADKQYQRALRIRPSRQLLYGAAVNFYEWQRFEEAGALLAQTLELYPQDHAALNVRGMIKLQLGDVDSALKDFEASMALKSDLTVLSNLGLAHMLQGNYRQSRDYFLEVRQRDGASPIFLINLADAEQLLGNAETAGALYREVIERHESELAFKDLRALSQAYAQLEEFGLAIATLKRIGENRRGNAETHFNAALVYALAKQDIAALVEVEQALAAGFGAIWFTLPWFDGLCDDAGFGIAMAQSGLGGTCQQRAADLALD